MDNQTIISDFVEARKKNHFENIDELKRKILLEQEYINKLELSNFNTQDWLDLRKTIYKEYFNLMPKSMGRLKGWKKDKNQRLRQQANEFLQIYDEYFQLEDQIYFNW